MIPDGTRVLLVDQAGRKHVVAAERRMLEVAGLGVVDGAGLCDSSFGSSMRIGGREFHILRPSVKDLLGMIERRAQIMIPKDSFVIPLHLDLGCGSRVLEGGVGSGALSIVLLKAVGPTGRVVSYESREDHAALARRNVAMAGLEPGWDLRIGDVCTATIEGEFDAATLDIPNPWDALGNVVRSVGVGGHVCCYVPNANQLESCVKKMRDIGLGEITAFETLQREMVVHEGGVRPSFDMLGHTGYLAFARKRS